MSDETVGVTGTSQVATSQDVSLTEVRQPVDLTTSEGFHSGADLLASFQPGTKSAGGDRFVEIHVEVPSYGHVTGHQQTTENLDTRREQLDVFIDTSTGYLVGFRAASNQIFALIENSSPPVDYASLLTSALKKSGHGANSKVIPFEISVDHQSLGTLEHKFDMHQLRMTSVLKTCENAQKEGSAHYKAALSTLVCMLAEAPRSTIVESQFARIYRDNGVVDNSVLGVVQYFGDALSVHRVTAASRLSDNQLIDTICETRTLLESEAAKSTRNDVIKLALSGPGISSPAIARIHSNLSRLGLNDEKAARSFFSKVGGSKGDIVLETSLGLRARSWLKRDYKG